MAQYSMRLALSIGQPAFRDGRSREERDAAAAAARAAFAAEDWTIMEDASKAAAVVTSGRIYEDGLE